MSEKLTTLAKRLRPFFAGQVQQMASSGALYPAVGLEINKIIYLPLTGSAVFYEKTAANLTTALAGMAAGTIVQINGPCTLADDFTVKAGCMLRAQSRYEVVLQGQVTLAGDYSSIFNLTIEHTANDANAIYGVQGPTSGTGYILYSDITATQSGAGNAYAIGAVNGLSVNNGNIEVHDSYLYGVSVGGSGYAARSTAGAIDIYHGQCHGSTARYILS